jgi:hypothetical protein
VTLYELMSHNWEFALSRLKTCQSRGGIGPDGVDIREEGEPNLSHQSSHLNTLYGSVGDSDSESEHEELRFPCDKFVESKPINY